MKTPSVLLLAGTLLVAGSAAVLVRALLQPAPAPVVQVKDVAPPPPKPPQQAILVARHDLQPGAFLDMGAMQWQAVESSSSSASLLFFVKGQDDAREVMGATLRQPIKAGEAISRRDVVKPGEPGFIAAVIRPGYRAISVPTSAVASNSGLISTGDRVDVILSLERDQGEASGPGQVPFLASQTLLQDIRVLALNNVAMSELQLSGEQAEPSDSRRYSRYDTVTLEVLPREAEQLAVAKEVGTLQLVVRGRREAPLQGQSDPSQQRLAVTTLPQATQVYQSRQPSSSIRLFRGEAVEERLQ
ncbi:Flp pilus assembly protein CpaB [Terasakiispira papahanaumokuakeensis]|uniref:Flp pilus assembly protein CpaB n=1 Tax=Terasakiispira papahanaumokuakeensis TaxID=197479 RepID=A0A1E2V5J0_9GAMM|nr:Flp pilus assembly protein CpaB [Terasakiispira papahanaumokuakeensis]ODC02251.1 Flp pilus assembly protein CpaB [Terasakiispira papahanaumokuakeensis]